MCHKTGTLPKIRQCHVGSVIQGAPFRLAIPIQISKFRDLRNLPRFGPHNAFSPEHEALAMREMRGLGTAPNSPSRFSGKRSRSTCLEIDSWMPSKIQAISPLVDRLMRLIEGSQCVPGAELDVELALREALGNAVLHGNQEQRGTKVHIRCRCWPGSEVTIVVTDEGKGFDYGKMVGDGLPSDSAAEHGRGILLMKSCMDEVHFERGGSEVHMRKRARSASH
jgi:serine/threonine-protein kinase RsbW